MDFEKRWAAWLKGVGIMTLNIKVTVKFEPRYYGEFKIFGWSPEKFKKVDGVIESDRHGYNRVADEIDKIDRYGKKYSWIAYFELSGWLHDHKLLKPKPDYYERTWDVDIDPSFPARSTKKPLISKDFLGDRNTTTKI